MQWASNADFGLLRSVLLETNTRGLVVVGACRLVAMDHRLSVFLQGLSSRIEIHDITVPNLSPEAVRDYVSTLADALYTRTTGNAFFIKALLSDLLDEKQLVWNEGVWVWNVEDTEPQDSCQDMLLFMAHKLSQQPPDIQDLLMLGTSKTTGRTSVCNTSTWSAPRLSATCATWTLPARTPWALGTTATRASPCLPLALPLMRLRADRRGPRCSATRRLSPITCLETARPTKRCPSRR